MEVQSTLHMVGGEGETSYAKNSGMQKTMATTAKAYAKIAITDLLSKSFPKSLSIADMGCSSGPNSLTPTLAIIDAVHETCLKLGRPSPELQVFLNDLPGNDFNSIFKSVPFLYEKLKKEKGEMFGQCFIAGVPGSFYGRLFPSQTLHFVNSSTAIHWLSQVPRGIEDNKENILLGKTTPPHVWKAYADHFNRDFFLFLSSRAEEVVCGGCMVISTLGRKSLEYGDEYHFSELLSKSFVDMISEGLVEEEKLHSFNLPMYFASNTELKDIIVREGSFHPDFMETFDMNVDPEDNGQKEYVFDKVKVGRYAANTFRAITESMIIEIFGGEILDELFDRYATYVGEYMLKKKPKIYFHLLCLTKK